MSRQTEVEQAIALAGDQWIDQAKAIGKRHGVSPAYVFLVKAYLDAVSSEEHESIRALQRQLARPTPYRDKP